MLTLCNNVILSFFLAYASCFCQTFQFRLVLNLFVEGLGLKFYPTAQKILLTVGHYKEWMANCIYRVAPGSHNK